MHTIKDVKFSLFHRRVHVLAIVAALAACSVSLVAARQTTQKDDLTGNWVVRTPNVDGSFRLTYVNLKQEGSRITGYIRLTQFYYVITESTASAEGFTLTGTMQDGRNARTVKYEVKLVGDELHLSTRRQPTAPPIESVAHRAPAGEGALPARIAPPALHKVPDNGLARTPPMGWNSWNKFAGRIDDATVRGIADAMAGNGMKDAGYLYVNIDDTWEAGRDARGNIQTNKKFPCLLYTSPSPRDRQKSRMPSSA